MAAVESTGTVLTSFRQFVRDGAAVLYAKKWDRSGSTWVASSDKLYVYAGGRMAATKERTALSGTPVTTYTYYAVDHLGTVRYSRTLDPNGTLVTGGAVTYKAEPFGVTIPGYSTPVNGNTHFYTGHERDTLPSGFNQDYMHFRYFSASMGRFQKPDSVFQSAAANPQGFNLYSYVHGNPVNFCDSTGHSANETDADQDGADEDWWDDLLDKGLGTEVVVSGGGGGSNDVPSEMSQWGWWMLAHPGVKQSRELAGPEYFLGTGLNLNLTYAFTSWSFSSSLLWDSQGNLGVGFCFDFGVVALLTPETLGASLSHTGTLGSGSIYTPVAVDQFRSADVGKATFFSPGCVPFVSGQVAWETSNPQNRALTLGYGMGASTIPIHSVRGTTQTAVFGFNMRDALYLYSISGGWIGLR